MVSLAYVGTERNDELLGHHGSDTSRGGEAVPTGSAAGRRSASVGVRGAPCGCRCGVNDGLGVDPGALDDGAVAMGSAGDGASDWTATRLHLGPLHTTGDSNVRLCPPDH